MNALSHAGSDNQSARTLSRPDGGGISNDAVPLAIFSFLICLAPLTGHSFLRFVTLIQVVLSSMVLSVAYILPMDSET